YHVEQRNVDRLRSLNLDKNSARLISYKNRTNANSGGPPKNSKLEPIVVISDDETLQEKSGQTIKTTPSSTAKQAENNSKRDELINNYKNWFDQLQLSGEELLKRLRSLIRIYRELQRLEFDIESYISERDTQNLLDRELMNEFRRLLLHIGTK
ncbi:14832_t:CDS:2, partial [Acaulospora colombiana]